IAVGADSAEPSDGVIADYLKLICPTPVAKTDFIGRGGDAGGKADFQGCSDFNPLIILSKQENKDLSKEQRNLENASDRRVVVFLFRASLKVNPALWPCPRSTESSTGCKARFFSDGERRRSPGQVRRVRKQPQANDPDETVAEDTFACRLYDRIAQLSPCERILREYQL